MPFLAKVWVRLCLGQAYWPSGESGKSCKVPEKIRPNSENLVKPKKNYSHNGKIGQDPVKARQR